jgi:hypothetical protein
MDDRRFDDLIRALSSSPSRRGVVAALLSATVLSSLGRDHPGAARKRGKQEGSPGGKHRRDGTKPRERATPSTDVGAQEQVTAEGALPSDCDRCQTACGDVLTLGCDIIRNPISEKFCAFEVGSWTNDDCQAKCAEMGYCCPFEQRCPAPDGPCFNQQCATCHSAKSAVAKKRKKGKKGKKGKTPQPWLEDNSDPGNTCCALDGETDLRTDAHNCGFCGNRCPDRKDCCGGECIDYQTDPNHCGGCGNRSPDDPYQCKAGQVCCDGGCFDESVYDYDTVHCGGCFQPVGEGKGCCGGWEYDPERQYCCSLKPRVLCSRASEECCSYNGVGTCFPKGEYCAECTQDAECGACEECVDFECTPSCDPDHEVCCDGRCVKTDTNENHCGGCGQPCADPAKPDCCNGECVNTQVDPAHCGACNAAAASGICCGGEPLNPSGTVTCCHPQTGLRCRTPEERCCHASPDQLPTCIPAAEPCGNEPKGIWVGEITVEAKVTDIDWGADCPDRSVELLGRCIRWLKEGDRFPSLVEVSPEDITTARGSKIVGHRNGTHEWSGSIDDLGYRGFMCGPNAAPYNLWSHGEPSQSDDDSPLPVRPCPVAWDFCNLWGPGAYYLQLERMDFSLLPTNTDCECDTGCPPGNSWTLARPVLPFTEIVLGQPVEEDGRWFLRGRGNINNIPGSNRVVELKTVTLAWNLELVIEERCAADHECPRCQRCDPLNQSCEPCNACHPCDEGTGRCGAFRCDNAACSCPDGEACDFLTQQCIAA